MPDYLDVEVTIYKGDAYNYGIQLQIADPRKDQLEPVRRGAFGCTPLNLTAELGSRLGNPENYGRFLWDSLIYSPEIKRGLDEAFSSANDKRLRIRLIIDPSAPELHAVRWETLRQPGNTSNDDHWLASDERVLFSRLLPSAGRGPAGVKPQDQLQALVLISNPSNLSEWSLAALDVDKEMQIAQDGLGSMIKKELVSKRNQPGEASLEKLRAAIREGFDILYLVCHGAIRIDDNQQGHVEPHLWLEAPDGTSDVVPGHVLIECLSQLDVKRPPRLIVLASCQSAGYGGMARESDKEAVLSALGPKLASQVAPAVLAIQDNISFETSGPFMRAFFSQLREHGQIDRAAAAARGEVRNRHDAWMPVLYMSLKSGSIWYAPRFAEAGDEGIWLALLASITAKKCLPILGPGLTETLLGSVRDIASTWAQTYGYALAPRYRDEWPQVSQYVVKWSSLRAMRSAWQDYLQRRLQNRLPDIMPVDLSPLAIESTFDQLLVRLRAQDPLEPHTLLAALPIPIYLTTNQDDLLASALAAAGKQPVVYVCRWRQFQPPEIYTRAPAFGVAPGDAITVGPDYVPNANQPLVYHLFGHMRWPESLVITEDDYFDYLMLVNTKDSILPPVEAALTLNALAFLGFQVDDWRFRVLFRSIMTTDRLRMRALNPEEEDKSVAVQVNPEEGTFGPDRARNYLEKYFRGAKIDSYWGSATDFVSDLWQRWQATQGHRR